MKKRAAALLCLCVLALTGCAGRIELCLMAVCLGVDVEPEGVTLTVKCPEPVIPAMKNYGQNTGKCGFRP